MRWLCLIVATLLLSAPLPALAQEADAYPELIREALAEYHAASYREALTLFERAHRIKQSARTFRAMGKCHFELGDYVSALDAIDGALASDVEPLDERLREDMQELRTRTERYIGAIELTITPAQARVLLNGRAVEAAEAMVNMGDHVVDVSAQGYESERRVVTVPGGERVRLQVTLKKTPPAGDRETVINIYEPNYAPIIVASIVGLTALGGAAASAAWLSDRASAVDACDSAAGAGSACENADTIETEHDAALGVLIASSALAVGAGVMLAVTLASGEDGQVALTLSPGPMVMGPAVGARVEF